MKNMIHKCDVLLIRPPLFHDTFAIEDAIRIDMPLGLLYLASTLMKNNNEVCIYDSYADVDIEALKKIYKSSEGPYLIGSSYETVLEKISLASPRVIGITCMFNKNVQQVIEISKLIKHHFPDKIIAVGGASVTSFQEEFVTRCDNSIDIFCKGEGESTIVKIMEYADGNAALQEIPGIIFKGPDNQYIETEIAARTKDLDTIPVPAYGKVDMEHYFYLRSMGFVSRNTYNYPNIHRGVVFITSRGCPYKCIFCGNHLHMGRGIRFHSVGYIIEHIKFLNSRYGVTHFHIEDDNLNANIKRFEKLIDEILRLPFNITWDASNGMRGDLLADEQLLVRIKKSGCNYLKIAVESGDQEIVNKVVKKNIDLEKVRKTAEFCKKIKIDLHAFYIIGFVGETIRNIENTIDFARFMQEELNVFPHMQIAEPIKGTELYYIAKEKNYLLYNPEGVYPYSITTPEFNEELLRAKYLKPFMKDAKLIQIKTILKTTNFKSILSSLIFFMKINKFIPFLSIKEKIYKTMLSKTMYVHTNSIEF